MSGAKAETAHAACVIALATAAPSAPQRGITRKSSAMLTITAQTPVFSSQVCDSRPNSAELAAWPSTPKIMATSRIWSTGTAGAYSAP